MLQTQTQLFCGAAVRSGWAAVDHTAAGVAMRSPALALSGVTGGPLQIGRRAVCAARGVVEGALSVCLA